MLDNKIFHKIREIKTYLPEVGQIKEVEEEVLRSLVTSMLKIRIRWEIMVERMITIEVRISQIIQWTTSNLKMEAMLILLIQAHMELILLNNLEALSSTNNNHMIWWTTICLCPQLSRWLRVSSWKISEARYKMGRRLKSETLKITLWNVLWTNMVLGSFSRSTMWRLKKRKN